MKIEVREEFIRHHFRGDTNELAEQIAHAKVRNVSAPYTETEALRGEVRFEETLIANPERGTSGILYDAPKLHQIYRDMIPSEELSLNVAHLLFTSRLFGTFDEGDPRYHARAILCGYPSMLSTSGIVEAPAKPREYYIIRDRLRALGEEVPAEVLKEQIRGRFLDYDDPRLTEVMKGYSLQALLYSITHEPFCENTECRLYNSHWQEEVITSQLGDKEFCPEHRDLIRQISGV
jgi:hypothetical protein